MGTLVLRSNDPLRRRQIPQSPKPNPRSNNSQPRRRRNPTFPARRAAEKPSPSPSKHLVMGQVRILKRGEKDLVAISNPKAVAKTDLFLSHPDPDVVRRNVRVSDLYAGAACLPSPPPSSLPFPSSLVKGGARRGI